MSFIIYLDKEDQPVRQMVPTDPEAAARYRRVTVFTQDEVDEMVGDGGECCPDCRDDHYRDGFADGEIEGRAEAEREAEDKIEELRNVVQGMVDGVEAIRSACADMESHAEEVGVCV